MTKTLFVAMKKGGDSVEQDWPGGRVVETLVLLIPILDPSSMEQYATAETCYIKQFALMKLCKSTG